MTRLLLASAALLLASPAFAKEAKKADACAHGAIEIMQCLKRQGRLFTGLNIRTCSDRKTYAVITGNGPTDGAIELARFAVHKQATPHGIMGAPQVWLGTGFRLSVNFTTAPIPGQGGMRNGSLRASLHGNSWNMSIPCGLTR